jgi:hypothetical protein
MRLIDLYWLVAPDVKHVGFAAPLDFILPIGLGSLCLSLFLNELKKRPFFVLYDPNLPETNVHLTEAKHA